MEEPRQTGGVSRHAMEVFTAILTGALGLLVCYGAYRIGIGWEPSGPASGYFPFWIGVLIVFGSLVNLIRPIVLKHHKDDVFLDAERLKRVASFFLPIVAFAIISVLLGLYVGTILYIAGAMRFQGRYAWWISALSGVAVALGFYLVFEIGFQVPLLKGPVEAWFGLY